MLRHTHFTLFTLWCIAIAAWFTLLSTSACGRLGGYTVTTNTINENNTAPIYHISAALPRLQKKTSADSLVANKINEVIDYYIKSQIEQFKTDITLSRQMAEQPETPDTPAGELQIKTTIGLTHAKLYSVNISTLYHNTAAAYPQYIERCFTFDAQTGEALTLSQLFYPDESLGCFKTISDYITPLVFDKQSAAQILPDSALIAAATAPMPQNFTNFLLYPDRISFYFPYHTISTQLQPDLWIDMPYEVIKPCLLKKYQWQ